jgi:hypothetical protein
MFFHCNAKKTVIRTITPRITILFLSTIRATNSQIPTFNFFFISVLKMAANVVNTNIKDTIYVNLFLCSRVGFKPFF